MQTQSNNNNNKTAIVTGAASGIGRATAEQFASEGYKTVIVDLKQAAAETTARELTARGFMAHAFAGDVSSPDSVHQICDAVQNEFGTIDVIVNNAGIMTFKPIDDLNESDWISVLKVDLLGAFFFIQEGFKRMKPGSAIVNVASIHAIETTPNVAPYAAAKAAMVSLTHSAALEGKSRGIRVCAVLPGAIDTPMLWENPNVKAGLETIGREDVGKPENIANAIAFLASSRAEFIQGSTLVVDGGRLARL